MPRVIADEKCLGCGKLHETDTGRFDHLMYLSLRRKHAKGPEVLCGWVCDEGCAALALATLVNT